MKAHRYSRGITLLGFLVMLCVAGFFAYVVMKLVPVYVEYFGVVKAMEQIKDEPGEVAVVLEGDVGLVPLGGD